MSDPPPMHKPAITPPSAGSHRSLFTRVERSTPLVSVLARPASNMRRMQLSEAIRHIERAHALDPNYGEARNNLEMLKALQKTPR